MKENVSIFWFRRDLRLYDNTALYQALRQRTNVMPIFIFDRTILDKLPAKQDKRVCFIYDQLAILNEQLKQYGSTISVFYGYPEQVFTNLTEKYSVEAIYTNEDYEPAAIERDKVINTFALQNNISFHSYKDIVIWAKDEVVKEDNSPYTVFTPYSKKWKEKLSNSPFSIQRKLNTTNFIKKNAEPLPSLATIGFDRCKYELPNVKIDSAKIIRYNKTRDFPAIDSTSKLSVHLRFGTISIRQLYENTHSLNATFINELIWREFYQQILWHFPHTAKNSFKKEYDNIEWENNEKHFNLWCEGKTGYPFVDAGMRQLNETGWMHNRVRMIVASFLTKHLLIDWRWGEAYFAQKLMDYDMAANVGGWQWAAGCGTDAAPYFRVFNPILQQEKFDKDNTYIQRWIPEWNTPLYPQPIVAHQWARERCLKTYKKALNKI